MSFRLDPLVDGLQKVLDLRQEQHGLTAANLANVDTPGYRARVIDFETALSDAMGQGEGLALRTTDAHHLSLSGGAESPEILELAPPPYAEDGNSVLAERETSLMVANQLVYSGVARVVSARLAMLRFAASDGKA